MRFVICRSMSGYRWHGDGIRFGRNRWIRIGLHEFQWRLLLERFFEWIRSNDKQKNRHMNQKINGAKSKKKHIIIGHCGASNWTCFVRYEQQFGWYRNWRWYGVFGCTDRSGTGTSWLLDVHQMQKSEEQPTLSILREMLSGKFHHFRVFQLANRTVFLSISQWIRNCALEHVSTCMFRLKIFFVVVVAHFEHVTQCSFAVIGAAHISKLRVRSKKIPKIGTSIEHKLDIKSYINQFKWTRIQQMWTRQAEACTKLLWNENTNTQTLYGRMERITNKYLLILH